MCLSINIYLLRYLMLQNWKVIKCNIQVLKRIPLYNCYIDSLEYPVYTTVHYLLRHACIHVRVGVSGVYSTCYYISDLIRCFGGQWPIAFYMREIYLSQLELHPNSSVYNAV